MQVAAPPGCEAQAREFFGGLLELAEIEKPPALRARGGVWFQAGAQQLHVGVADGFAAARKAHPALAVHSGMLSKLAERLQGAGCVVRWDDAQPDARRFFTEDPWGNRLELVEHVA